MKKKIVVLVLAAVLVFGCVIGGTLAWLMDKTQTVTNVFTAGNVKITLAESDADGDDDADNNVYKMVPGNTIEKDPKITVNAVSEDAWIFVKVEKINAVDTFLTYAIADGWTALVDENGVAVDGVYYREYTANAEGATYPVIADNTVTVKGEVSQEQLEDLTEQTYPTLAITAYAVQKDNVANAAAAWAVINPPAEETPAD